MKKSINLLYIISTILLLVGLILHLIVMWYGARYILLLGSLGYMSSVVLYTPHTHTLRIKRLLRLAHLSGLLWVAGSIALFFGSSLWITFYVAACIFMLYSNIHISSQKHGTSK